MRIKRVFINEVEKAGSQIVGFAKVTFVAGEFMFSTSGIGIHQGSDKSISLRFPAQKYGRDKLRWYFKADNKEFEEFIRKAVEEELEAVRIFKYQEEE